MPLSESDTTIVEELEEVVVTSLRQDVKLVETPANLAVVKARDFTKYSAITVSDVLKYEPGVSMGGDGVWATSVNIRGLNESRLVTLVDGNRIETASDMTAAMSMFDVNDIKRVEVVKGSQSSLFGSGAMGGIVNVITKDGHFADKPYFSGSAILGYASVNNYFNPYLSLETGRKKWYFRVSGSYGNAQDIMTPKGKLENSSFRSWNINAKLGIKPLDNHLLKIQFQHNHSKDVGVPGGAAIAPTATADYKNISRTLVDLNYEIKDLTETFASLSFRGFYQDIPRDVELQPNTSVTTILPTGNTQITTPELITAFGSHRTAGGMAQAIFNFGEWNNLIAGIDVWQRHIDSDRVKYIDVKVASPEGAILAANKIQRGETPLPRASFTSAGIFAQDEMRFFDDRFKVTVGGRLDGIFVKNDECHDVDWMTLNGVQQPVSPRVTYEAGKTSELSWSVNLGALYKVGSKTDLVLNLARSYRAASLEERFRFIDLTSKVQMGNPNLKPESGYAAELGVRYWGKKFTLQSSIFANRLIDMIVEMPGEFQGTPALIYQNVDKAILAGADFNANYTFNYNWNAFAAGSYIIGIDTDKQQWLPNIPPMSLRLGGGYTYPKIGAVNLSIVLVGARLDNQIATGEKPTDGYYRIDLSLNSKMFTLGTKGTLQFFGGIDNLTNVAYTNFLSTNRTGINYEPGINAYIKACITF